MIRLSTNMSPKQQFFNDMVLGALVYSVVLGFFEQYTAILSTWSYSITFLVAIVMQILTYLALRLKSQVVTHFQKKTGKSYTAVIILSVWAIMFFSKFIFLAVIDLLFGHTVTISGFIGLLLVIMTMTLAKKGIDLVYQKLA